MPGRVIWSSGASRPGKAIDTWFDDWRGLTSTIAGTWNDGYEAQINQWTLRPQFFAGPWQKDLDNAVGAIFKERGETWSKAATGSYDQRWRDALTTMKKYWADKPGTMYIRFAHEFNGNWYGWSVKKSEIGDFKQAWMRFRSLQKSVFPAAKLVFSPNADTMSSFGTDWRSAFPGRAYVDVVSVDYYNQYPFVRTAQDWSNTLTRSDQWGGPRGLERHRQFAESVGLPFAISEWSSNGSMGDSPAFVEGLYNWLSSNAGTGAGQILYEIQFSVPGYSDNFQFFPVKKQPKASAAYARLWG